MYLKLTFALNYLKLTAASSTSTFRKMTFLFSGNAASACNKIRHGEVYTGATFTSNTSNACLFVSQMTLRHTDAQILDDN